MERIINIKIFKSGKIDMDTKHWGVQNEKNITKLLFTFPEELESYNKEILFDFGMNQVVTDLIQNNQYTVDNNVSCYTNIDVAVRVTNQDGTKLFESLPESVEFDESLEPTDDMPTPEEVSKFNTMINTLNEKIEEVEETKEGIANISISAVKEETATTVTITKADGTQESFIVEDGKNYILTDEDKEEIAENTVPIVSERLQPTLDNNLQIAKDYADSIKPTKTSELTNDSDFAVTNSNNNFNSSQTINGVLTVNGDIVQKGEQYESHAEKVYSKNDEIITRDGAVGGLSDGEYTGIQALLYDGENNGRLGFNAKGEARVGDIGDEQPLLTRDEIVNLQEGQVLIWDGKNLKAVGSSDFVKNTDFANISKAGVSKMWTSTNEDGEIGLNISTEV